jgi:hypothetical protein
VSDNALPDSALAVALGAATLSGLVAGLGVWVASPSPLRVLSYCLFAGASVMFIIVLILVGVTVTALCPGPTDEDGGCGPGGPTPPPAMVPEDQAHLDEELRLLLEQV